MYESNSVYDSNEYIVDNHNDLDQWIIRQDAQYNSFEIQYEKNSDVFPTNHEKHQSPHVALPNEPPSQIQQSPGPPTSSATQNTPKVIECNNTKLFKIHKTKKGRANETKNLVQFFKNQTTFYLSIMEEYNMLALSESCYEKLQKFKQESTSLVRFYQLLAQSEIRHKLQDYFHSGEFLKKIMLSDRLGFNRKIQVVKNINVMQKILWDSQVWNADKHGKEKESREKRVG